MEIKGRLIDKMPAIQITDSFKKQEFVIEFAENPEYPELIKFETIQDKCGLIDKFEIQTELMVSFNLKGRKWDDPKGGAKYFNTLQAWKISKLSSVGQAQDHESDLTDENGDLLF